MNPTKTAKIATANPGFCDSCDAQFAETEDVAEFVFSTKGRSCSMTFATCSECNRVAAEAGAISARPTRVLVQVISYREGASTYRATSTVVPLSYELAEFILNSATKLRFEEEVAA